MATVAEGRTATSRRERSLRLGATRYPVDLPSWRDARLHTSLVVLTLHVLGQVALDFRVSVPQILCAIGASAALEVGLTFWRRHRISWPASAILTGSGVGLILRISGPGAANDIDHWSWSRWYLFAGVSVVSLASKYVIRFGGSQVFNPSNLGLLAVFLLLGSDRVEPLDLWWAPGGAAMTLAYAVILAGGLLIVARLGLFPLAAAFWVTLAAGSGVLASSGHCITTNWSSRPVCDGGFWWLLMTSPEILVFLFFMITDPRTAPQSAPHRAVFGGGVALLALFLMAPYRSEFATKVALFAALAIVCALRAVGVAALSARGARGPAGGSAPTRSAAVARVVPSPMLVGAALPIVVGLTVLALVTAGRPARQIYSGIEASRVMDRAVLLAGLDLDPDPHLAALPIITTDPAVARFDASLGGAGAERVARSLLVGLAVEAEALRSRDPALLRAVDHGARLAAMDQRLQNVDRVANAGVIQHTITAMHLHVVRLGGQAGSLLAVDTEGYVATGASTAVQQPARFRFVLRPAGPRAWLIVDGKRLDRPETA